jgi:hypothetical protein
MGLRCRRADRAGHRGHGGSLGGHVPGSAGVVAPRGADDELDRLVGRRWKLDVRLLDDVYQQREALPRDLVERLPHGG